MCEIMTEKPSRNCTTCKYGQFADCETLQGSVEYQTAIEKGSVTAFKFKKSFVCDFYKSRYIEYPIEVSEIEKNTELSAYDNVNIGKFVKIRPCGDEKTYLGLHLGGLPIDMIISHQSETKILDVRYHCNPAIFVFDLNKIVYGMESWWGIIKTEADLRAISNEDIENVWYVKALKSLDCQTNMN